MRNASDQILALDAGSKNRLKIFRNNLRRDRDDRNFDSDVEALIRKYVLPSWSLELRRTEKYLFNLRSSKDGKLYSQGVKEYSKLEKAALEFAEPNHTYFGWNRAYQMAKADMIEEFSKIKLAPRQWLCDDDIVKDLPKRDTHAGFEYIRTGLRTKGEYAEGIFSEFMKRRKDALESGSFSEPILPAVRTQGNGHAFEEDGSYTGDCDHKTRLVMMVSLHQILGELMFAKPVQQYLARTPWYAGGKAWDGGVSRIVNSMRMRNNYWVSLDYSGFDHSISAWLIHDAFDIIRHAFSYLTEEQSRLLDVVEHDFISKEIILSDRIIRSAKGVPSGSMFTQIVDSIVNRLSILTYFHSKGIDGDMIIMGDDNLIYTQVRVDLRDLSSYVLKNLGLVVNADKSKSGLATKSPTFLSCVWKPEGRYREPHEVLAKLLYPERQRDYTKAGTDPKLVLWSYVLTYGLGVNEFIDVRAFLADNPTLNRTNLKMMDSRNMPGLLRYLKDYTLGYWSPLAA